MTNTQVPLSAKVINLIEKNSELLAKEFQNYLKENGKCFEYKDIYPLESLKGILSEQFINFNKENIYTKEIENGLYSTTEKDEYYDNLFNYTVPKAMVLTNSED